MAEDEKASKADLLVRALKWTAGAMQPFSDPAVRREILASLGASVDGEPPEFLQATTVASLNELATKPDGELTAEMSAIASGLGDVLKVIDDARGVANSLKLGDQLGPLDITLDTFLHVLPNVLSMNYLRVRRPGIWSLFKMLQLLDDRAALPFGEAFAGRNWRRLFTDDEDRSRWGRSTDEQRTQTAVTLGISAILLAKLAGTLLGKLDEDLPEVVQVRAFPGWDPWPGSRTPRADFELARTTTLQLVFGPEPEAFETDAWNESRVLTLTFLVPPKEIDAPLIVTGSGEASFSRTFGDVEVGLSARFGADAANDFAIKLFAKRQGRLSPLTITEYVTLGDLTFEAWLSSAGHGVRLLAAGNSLNLNGKAERDAVTGAALGHHDVRAAFDVDLTFDTERGFRVGSSGIRVDAPVKINVGPAQVDGLHVGLGLGKENGGLQLTATVGLRFALGPFTAAAEGVGFELLAASSEFGNLGLLHVEKAGFKPPEGVGLSLDLAVTKGSGYLGYDRATNQYVGAFQVKLTERYGLSVTGLLATRMPDGSQGMSLLLQGSMRMSPGWPAGYFTITRIGLVFGYHRRFDLEALRAGIRAGMVETLLAPPDPLTDLAKSISNLTTLFPVAEGKYTVGLSVRLQRTDRVTLDLGLLYDTSEPHRIVVAGLLQVNLQKQNKLKLAAVGDVDLQKGEMTLLASIYESKLAGAEVEGDAAVLVRWKSPRTMVIAIGGFHPDYRGPETALQAFSKLKRVTVKMPDSAVLKLSLSAYVAVTPSSLQLGAKITAWVGIERLISLDGEIAFDALLEFEPFYVDVAVKGRVSLKVLGESIAGVRLEGRYRGPDPAQLAGKVTFEVLWWDVSYCFDRKAPGEPPPPPEPVDPVVVLRTALASPLAWSVGELPISSGSVRLAEATTAGRLLLHPLQRLSFLQEAVPFDQDLDKVGEHPVLEAGRLHLEGVALGSAKARHASLTAQFARGAYQRLSEEQVFSLPAYEPMVGGATIDPELAILAGAATHADSETTGEVLLGSLREVEPSTERAPAGLDTRELLRSSASMLAVKRATGLGRLLRATS